MRLQSRYRQNENLVPRLQCKFLNGILDYATVLGVEALQGLVLFASLSSNLQEIDVFP